MFSLLSGFYEYVFSKPIFKVLIVGLDGAGKTTLLEHIKQMEGQRYLKPDKIPPTVGLNIGRVDRKNVELIIWDVGGQHTLRKIWEKYYGEADCIIFVVDGADQIRFDEVRETIEAMYKENETLTKKPLLILQNKCDSATFSTEEISTLESVHQISGKTTKTLQISALEGTGVANLLDWIIGTLTSKQFA